MLFDILALDGSSPGGLSATADVLETANRLGADPAFSWRLVGATSEVRLRFGLTVEAEPIGAARPGNWIVVLGLGSAGPEEAEARLAQPDVAAAARWIRQAHAAGARVATSCTGAFVLAEAGVLARRRCTTSWWLQGLLARRAPAATIEADAMVVEDDPIWTAGPSYAHLDLMLTLVARATSPDLSQAVGRRLSADLRLSQGAFIDAARMGAAPILEQLEAVVGARLSERISLQELAEAAGCSARTLTRRIHAETGLSPMRFVQKLKLNAALRLIRAGDLPLARIAEQVGLADATALHRLVVRHTSRAPGSFRTS